MQYITWATGLTRDDLDLLDRWHQRRGCFGASDALAAIILKRPLIERLNEWAVRALVHHLTHGVKGLRPEAAGMLRADLSAVRWSPKRLGAVDWCPTHVRPILDDLFDCLAGECEAEDLVASFNQHYGHDRHLQQTRPV